VKNSADLLRAAATLLWPLIMVGVLWHFRREISNLLTGHIRVKLPGGVEAELGELGETVPKAQDDAAEEARQQEVATSDIEPPIKTPASDTEPQEIDTIRRILDEATESAKVGLISLATEIERELRLILASRGVDTTRFRGVHGGIAALQGQGHFLHLYKLGEHILGCAEPANSWHIRYKFI
jgi:hypothetical protein